MTLAILRALLVKANGQTFAVPLTSVLQVSRLNSEDCEPAEAEGCLRLSGEDYPRLVLADALGLAPGGAALARPPVLLLGAGGKRAVLVVDQLLGAREVVVKGLGNHVRHLRGIAGATLLGDGSVVLILNPGDLMQPEETLPVRPSAAARDAPRPLSVLVVDDSPSVRRVLSNLVRGAGWTPLTARDGVEALERLHAGPPLPDVILLDIEMPRMDGFELLGAMRADPALRHLPVAMVTSRAGDKHRRKTIELGANAHLVKPCQEDELLATVRRLAAITTD
jgi:chemosensory pili system protein ChpA (sensor histidine kinase/response regulator)